MRSHRTAAAATTQQNAYATFQSSVALQGINPALVGNPLTNVIQQAGTNGTPVSLGSNTTQTAVRDRLAAFELRAVSQPIGAQRNLVGSARVDAVNYAVGAAGTQGTRGAGVGFGDRDQRLGSDRAGLADLQCPGRPHGRDLSPEQHRDVAVDQPGGNDLHVTRRTARSPRRPVRSGTTIPGGPRARFRRR